MTLTEFNKKKPFLVCVDSDGCAMDTMDVKHYRCFGPCMVDEWELDAWREEVLARWNEINLYTVTRGINRFKGLAAALGEIHTRYTPIPGIEALCEWAEHSPELSNTALNRMIEQYPDVKIFAKALAWSMAVNKAITALPDEVKQPFPLAREALAHAHTFADVAVVSSANLDAVLAEWQEHGLLAYVDVVCSQNDGSKAYCIQRLLEQGYDKSQTVMCGDAPGDLAAAEKNGVYFYPILVKAEQESWGEFIDTAAQKLQDGTFGGDYAQSKMRAFYANLGET